MKINPFKLQKIIAKVIPYAIIVVLSLLLFKQCEKSKRLSEFALNQSSKVELYKNKIGTLTATVKASELSEKELKKLVLQKNDSLKKLASEFSKVQYVTVIKEVIKIDSVKVPFEAEIPCEFERLGKYDADTHFKFNYALNQKGFDIFNIEIPNKQTIITGTKRKWFLGKQTLHTDITNSNPYLQTQEVQTIIVPIEKKWYENQFLWLGVGTIGGVLLAKR